MGVPVVAVVLVGLVGLVVVVVVVVVVALAQHHVEPHQKSLYLPQLK